MEVIDGHRWLEKILGFMEKVMELAVGLWREDIERRVQGILSSSEQSLLFILEAIGAFDFTPLSVENSRLENLLWLMAPLTRVYNSIQRILFQ